MREIHAPPTLPSGAPPGIVPRRRLRLVHPDQPLTCPGAHALQAGSGRGALDPSDDSTPRPSAISPSRSTTARQPEGEASNVTSGRSRTVTATPRALF
ncbi:hypothetical protein SVIO_106450 [Streptomyces violaceusniger]|uniref:Uncharacterized protein n=1 Tax=Streptomyces violaceusniger TaxID=68280 RepID=A0A4D4LFG6_STRVO|nr:hypothetical protein SVIO_106450 [Streptomyces violaceusniger]